MITKNIRMESSRERWTERPRIRWLGGVCSDLKVMNVNKWGKKWGGIERFRMSWLRKPKHGRG